MPWHSYAHRRRQSLTVACEPTAIVTLDFALGRALFVDLLMRTS